MIAVDTNIVVRLLTQDDPEQCACAQSLFDSNTIFVLNTVVLECGWVLKHAYGFAPDAICAGLRALFGLTQVELENPVRVATALELIEGGVDFADAFHLAGAGHCSAFATFDKKFISTAPMDGPCPVRAL